MIIRKSKFYPLAVIDSTRLLAFNNGCLWIIDSSSFSVIKYVSKIPDYKFAKLSRFRIFQRIFRNLPGPIIALDKNTYIYHYRSNLYRIDLEKKSINIELELRQPRKVLCFHKIVCPKSGSVSVYFGEYFENRERDSVNVWERDNLGKWSVYCVFPSGTIDHVHNVVHDKFRNRLIILTGDFGSASGLWAVPNKGDIPKGILTGSQMYRATWMHVSESKFIYATDTPFEKNYLIALDFSSDECNIRKLHLIGGSSIYGVEVDSDTLLFSTAVEPVELTGNKLIDIFQRRRGEGILEDKAFLYRYSIKSNCLEIISSAKKDIIPMRLGQYGTFYISDSLTSCGHSFCYGNALVDFDSKVISV